MACACLGRRCGGPSHCAPEHLALLTELQAHRTEALISENILRSGPWKLVTGGVRFKAGHERQAWETSFLKGCTLGTGGGWHSPAENRSNMCPKNAYTGGGRKSLSCPQDFNRSDYPVNSTADLWLCSVPCSQASPCLWNVEDDEEERHEVSARFPAVVQRLSADLLKYAPRFANATHVRDNGKFCSTLRSRTVNGRSFLGPWLDE